MLKAIFNRNQTTGYETISPKLLHQQMQTDANLLILDVRSADEYGRDGHINGSRLMPLNTLPSRAKELPKNTTIVCVCRSGARSQVACETLSQQGFKNVINMKGGMILWRIQRLPITQAI